MKIYKRFQELSLDSRWIGLEKNDFNIEYFCTPIGATIIGWENNIHYCFIDGYDNTIFTVNPESLVDKFVYPLAKDFKDFLRLILACGSTTAVEQIIGWNKEQFEQFIISENNKIFNEQALVLKEIENRLKLTPMENPYDYVKSIQDKFDYGKIKFTDEYYEVLGIDNPNGKSKTTEPIKFGEVVFTFIKKG